MVSVLLIAYNHAPFVAQAIESILAQQVSVPFEVVAGDDGSSDGTREILEDFQRRHPQTVRLILPEANLGLGGNRMFLAILRACRGRYVAFLDGDDFWTCTDKLQEQVNVLDAHPNYSMCFHDVSVFDDMGAWPPYRFNSDTQGPTVTTADLLAGNVIQTCSAMVRRSIYDEMPDWVEGVEPQDWALYLIASREGDIAYINKNMGAYRRHQGAIWQGRPETFHLEKAVGFYNTLLDNMAVPGQADRIRAELAHRHDELSHICERAGDYRKAAEHLERCLDLNPPSIAADDGEAGATGSDVKDLLLRRLDRCRRPPFRRLAGRGLGVLARTARTTLRRIAGRVPGVRTGSLWIEERTPQAGATQVAVTLAWTSRRATKVTVRVGAPAGPLVSEGPSGRTTTGCWVRERTVFFLQDESDGRTQTPANTLAVLRAGDDGSTRGARRPGAAAYPPPRPAAAPRAFRAMGPVIR